MLQCATVCVFAGRAWQHLFFDAPFRELLWDPAWMQWFVERFTTLTWAEYMTHPQADVWISRLTVGHGVFYAFCALVAALVFRLPKQFHVFLWLGASSLVLLGLLYLKEFFFHAGQFFEYSLQFCSPVFLVLAIRRGFLSQTLVWWMKAAIAATFFCHGLYAVGYYPRPGTFLTMTMRILDLDNQGAVLFLTVAGWLDFAVAAGIFLPRRVGIIFLGYAAFWGLVTSLARVWGNFYWQFLSDTFKTWTHETVMRLPHFFVPLSLVFWYAGKRKTRE